MSSSVQVREWSNLRIVFGTFIGCISGYRFIRSQTRRNASTSTIAEAYIDITRAIFVRSRQRSTTYRLKRSGSMWSQQFAITGKRIC